jgi:hypothetical protein
MGEAGRNLGQQIKGKATPVRRLMRTLTKVSAYHWYLGSAFWTERRQHALERANYICERCTKRRATQVHHKTYLRVFKELPTDLMAVCKQCHADIHHKQAANDNQLSFKFEADVEDEED